MRKWSRAGSPFAASASTQFYVRDVRLADLNGDRHLDILTANGADNSLGVLFGDGRGGFSSRPGAKGQSTLERHTFAFGDVDGDGQLDAVVASRGNDSHASAA